MSQLGFFPPVRVRNPAAPREQWRPPTHHQGPPCGRNVFRLISPYCTNQNAPKNIRLKSFLLRGYYCTRRARHSSNILTTRRRFRIISRVHDSLRVLKLEYYQPSKYCTANNCLLFPLFFVFCDPEEVAEFSS